MSQKLNFGEFCWNELMTSDTKKAQAFYQDLFGWTSTKQDMGESTYTMFMQGDKTIESKYSSALDELHQCCRPRCYSR